LQGFGDFVGEYFGECKVDGAVAWAASALMWVTLWDFFAFQDEALG